VCTDTDEARLAHLREVHRRGRLDPELFDYVRVGHGETDELVRAAAPGSLVINATGLGKDRPGSPLSDDVVFPVGSYVWELNYRGSLELLHQARAQQEARQLTVVDGWRYFIHGWTQVIAEVFGVTMEPSTVERLAGLAEDLR
jgi:shikimate 5-dehydrogenase